MQIPDFGQSVQSEFNQLFIGEKLGEGCYREVFVYRMSPHWVIKYEFGEKSFSNVGEWEIWQEVKNDKKLARWFAPCIDISFSGSILIQARTEPITKLPKELPDFLADLKPENFGRLNGRIVAHDYGNHALFSKAFRSWRLRKVA